MKMFRADQLDADLAFALVIDFQERLLPVIQQQKEIVATACKLLDGLAVFELPLLATEQYSQGLGSTDESILARLRLAEAPVLEKPSFSVWAEPVARAAILEIDRPQVIITGIEAHICVQQSVLDLLSRDYKVFLCADATGSRGGMDVGFALDRMRQAGAFITTVESVLMELCHRSDVPKFKRLLGVLKKSPPRQH